MPPIFAKVPSAARGEGKQVAAIVLFTLPSMQAIDAFVSDADYRPYISGSGLWIGTITLLAFDIF
jgi:hypothetical protein